MTAGENLIEQFGVKQMMRDGVKLSSDLFIPNSQGKFPTILTRSPYLTMGGYDGKISYYEKLADEARFFAKNGYVYIIQDCRGKNDSEGFYDPFHDDGKDGYDTMEWIAKQPWSNGIIGTTGNSYSAWNQWATAVLNPPNLKAMISVVALPDPIRNVPYQGGELVLTMAEWVALISGKRNTPMGIYDSESILWNLPVRDIDKKFGRDSKIWQDWCDHPSLDDYWNETLYQDKLDRVTVPVMHVSGWYDDDVIGTHINYTSVANSEKHAQEENFQKLVIGPWPHHLNSSRELGGMDFGDTALIDLRGLKLRWFDRFLKGTENGIDKEKPVDIFLMGVNKWSKEESWPPKNVYNQKFYLNSGGRANTLFGDGTLEEELSQYNAQYDSYTYDPMDPTPHISNAIDLSGEGPFDQRPIERRDDVLVYQSAPLEKEVELAGPVSIKVSVSSSSVDTDFWVQLTDVYPNGYSAHLTENIMRCKYREGLDKPKLLRPDEIVDLDIDLWIVGNVFLKGHRIRLDIASSSFPKYARNLNIDEPIADATNGVAAFQKVFHSTEHQSYVTLPLRKK